MAAWLAAVEGCVGRPARYEMIGQENGATASRREVSFHGWVPELGKRGVEWNLHVRVSVFQNCLFAIVVTCYVCSNIFIIVDKKNQLDVNVCILYFCSNSCSTCFGQPCAHHQELTTT